MTAPEQLTRDVVRDLLPAYAAGEASPATRRVVEAWVAADPTLAREVEALRAGDRVLAAQRAEPSPDAERRAVERVRARLRARSLAMAGGFFFLFLPFTFHASSSRGLVFLLLRDAPWAAAGALLASAACWGVFLWLSRGLERR